MLRQGEIRTICLFGRASGDARGLTDTRATQDWRSNAWRKRATCTHEMPVGRLGFLGLLVGGRIDLKTPRRPLKRIAEVLCRTQLHVFCSMPDPRNRRKPVTFPIVAERR